MCVYIFIRCQLAMQCSYQPTSCEAQNSISCWTKNSQKAVAGILLVGFYYLV